jgi:uncharacterized protein (TIGR00266 family)
VKAGAEERRRTMKCQQCSAEISDAVKFCTVCGARVVTALASSSGSQEPPAGLRSLDTTVEHTPLVAQSTQPGRISYRIDGTTMQAVTVELEPGDVVYSETGGMSWMSGNVEMRTDSGGGLGRMLKRAVSGETLFVTNFYVEKGPGTIAFASEFPGKILPFDLAAGESLIVQKDAFMCAEKSVDLDLYFRKRLGAGLFGGEGFIMQRVTGPGLVFVEVDGEVVEYELERGQVLKVDTGHIAAYEPSVDFDVTVVKGISNLLLGGEGLFLASMRGPGKVWLQTMPMSKLARKVAQFMPQVGGRGQSGGLNVNLGTLLGGD